MEYCRGGKVDDLQYMKEQGIDKNVVLGYLSKIFSQMIFVRGYIHCDPHPGNVLVQKDANGRTQVVLLDHGLYQVRAARTYILSAFLEYSSNSLCPCCNPPPPPPYGTPLPLHLPLTDTNPTDPDG